MTQPCLIRLHLISLKVVPAKKSMRRRMMGLSNMGKKAFESGRLGAGQKGGGKRARRQRKQAPPLPYWFVYVAYAVSWLWMLVAGYFIVIYGLAFERDMCSFEKFERNECRPVGAMWTRLCRPRLLLACLPRVRPSRTRPHEVAGAARRRTCRLRARTRPSTAAWT